ncbi:unnamed protein product [Microthlaspi erraticum]|uniref:Protein kinase domain-containing protein n=1 Tax=Microthlaspi erraticum TaxID=1685480 RepID=A0A6D2JB72_9BRAS|nr:unnamed protein product [Microthlaspi erraticum]CAA7038197.1 unnamed protein product [Microthlaspi erraticum]
MKQNLVFAARLSPIILRPNMKIMKKKLPLKKISSIIEITEASFEASKPKSSLTHDGGGVIGLAMSSSLIEITQASFEAKKSSAVTHDGGGGLSNSSSWVKSRLLGRGAYGSVYLAKSKTDETERAIKTAELSRATSLMDEARILIRLNSPYVVRCYDAEIVREENQYNLVLEYCSGKTIADLIEDNHGELLESEVKLFARDILSGLNYIHDRGIVHCDIKPDNLLLCPISLRFRANGYLAKIGDFGLAMEKGSMEYGDGYGHKRGTTRYMSPELMSHGMVDFGADVWAFGCSVLEMLSGEIVWGEHGDLCFDDWANIIGHSDLMPRQPVWLSTQAKDFLSKCLERDVYKRWSAHSLANHPFAAL